MASRHLAFASAMAVGTAAVLYTTFVATAPQLAELGQSGRIEIRRPYADSEIVVGASARFAGAIDSLRWNGREFINVYDHGRQLQSASSFGSQECFNPTEAGSKDDGRGNTSTSQLLAAKVTGTQFTTHSRMAFWLAPGQTSRSCPGMAALNDRKVSDHELIKTVTLGVKGLPNVIEHDITFRVPERYPIGQFEVLTAYLPAEFSTFWTYDPKLERLAPLDDGPGEQPLPIIIATADRQYALGVYSPNLPQRQWPRAGYGRFRFAHLTGEGNATVKWNCVYRARPAAAGDHRYTCYSIVGTLDGVQETMTRLARQTQPRS